MRDALLWAIPAMVLGGFLRALLLSYLPYANWHADSNSYFSFGEHLVHEWDWDLDEKRRFTYPMLLAPVLVLPGSTLKWVAWLQHALGVLTLVPMAYCVRKCFIYWKAWVIPVTCAYALLPMILWFEHELLAEAFFFAAFIWTMAGWLAWTGAAPARRPALWWCFFVPFALLVLTKPAARFIWPGVALATLIAIGWRWCRLREGICLAAAALLTLMSGQESQGARLLYTSSFPLTRLDTPKHAELKAEVKDLVLSSRAALLRGEALVDREWKKLLEEPEKQSTRPEWQKLAGDEKLKGKVCRDLALEGILARPDLFLLISGQKILMSANPDDFKSVRLDPAYLAAKYQPIYERYAKENPWRVRNLYGLGKDEPIPPFQTVSQWMSPAPGSWAERTVRAHAQWFEDHVELVQQPQPDAKDPAKKTFRGTFLGWWLLAAITLSFLPWFVKRLGLWVFITLGYLFGVFLVGSANSRFFAMVWFTIVLILPVPLEALLRAIFWRPKSAASPSGSETAATEPAPAA